MRSSVVLLIDREVYHNAIQLNFDSLLELPASNSTRLGSALITSDYYEVVCYQTHEEQVIRDNVLTVGWFHSHDFQDYFKGFASSWIHSPATHGHLAFREALICLEDRQMHLAKHINYIYCMHICFISNQMVV